MYALYAITPHQKIYKNMYLIYIYDNTIRTITEHVNTLLFLGVRRYESRCWPQAKAERKECSIRL